MEQQILKYLISIIILLYFFLSIKEGYKDGFLKKFLSIATLIISIIITRFLTPLAVSVLKDYTNIQSTIADAILKTIGNSDSLNNMTIPGLDNIFNIGDLNDTISSAISNALTDYILYIACGILVFILSMLALKIIFKLLDFVDMIPVVGQFNKLLGAALGLFQSLLIIWIILALLKLFGGIPQLNVIEKYIKSSTVASWLYDNNVIYNFFNNIFNNLFMKK